MTYEIVFIAGLLSFFSPCIIPLLPIYLAQLAKGATQSTVDSRMKLNWYLIAQTLVFVTGIGTSFVLLGFGAGFLGQVFSSDTFLVICGTFAILMGLYQMGLLRLDFLAKERRIHSKGSANSGIFSSYLLGLTFSFGWTPCIGPVLAAILGIASSQGQGVSAAIMMLVYSAGLAVPFLIISIMGHGILDKMKKINPYLERIRILSGVLIILMGILLMTNNLNLLASGFQ